MRQKFAAVSWLFGFALLLGAVAWAGGQDRKPSFPANSSPAKPLEVDRTQLQNKGYSLLEVKDQLYWLSDSVYDCMFLVGEKGITLVDAPPNLGDKIVKAAQEVTKKPFINLVYTHHHTDHIGAASLIPGKPTIIAHKDTLEILARRKDPRRPSPTKTFASSMMIKDGSQQLELKYLGVNHSHGNIFVYAPKQKVLMLVDIVYPGWMPFKNLGVAEDVQGYIEAHDQAIAFDFRYFIGGHVDRTGVRADVETSKKFALDLKDTARSILAAFPVSEFAKSANTNNAWEFYEGYQNETIKRCVEKLRPGWVGVLKGTDVYLKDSCWLMLSAVQVELAPEHSQTSKKQ